MATMIETEDIGIIEVTEVIDMSDTIGVIDIGIEEVTTGTIEGEAGEDPGAQGKTPAQLYFFWS
jgi:hypothetical protein